MEERVIELSRDSRGHPYIDRKLKVIEKQLYKGMNSKNTALLIVDMTNSCAHKRCESPQWGIRFSKIRKMSGRLDKFVPKFRRAVKGSVIFTKSVPWEKRYLTDNLNTLYTDPRAYYYSEDRTGFPEKFYSVSPKKDDIVVTKNANDPFGNKAFNKRLNEKGIHYLVVTGILTDGCVLSTIVNGFGRGYNFVILTDLIETSDVKMRQDLQRLLVKYTFPAMYGKTLRGEEFLRIWKATRA